MSEAPPAVRREGDTRVVVSTVPGTLTVDCAEPAVAAVLASGLPSHYDHRPADPLPDGHQQAGCTLDATGSGDGVWAPIPEADWRRIHDRPTRDGFIRGLSYEHIQEYLRPDENAVEYVTKDGSWIRVDADGRMRGGIPPAELVAGTDGGPRKPLRDLVAVAFARVWRQWGWFVLHCSAVILPDGQAIAFPAFSGNGKSALLLATVFHGGGRAAGDDKLILREETGANGQPEIVGYPMQRFVNFTQDVADHYPQLAFIRDETDSPTWPKVRIDMSRAGLGDAPVPTITLSRICFPRVAKGAESSRLEPVSELDAVDQLLTQSVVSLEPDLARRHLRVITQLVAQCRCDYLNGGRDVYQSPAAFCEWLRTS